MKIFIIDDDTNYQKFWYRLFHDKKRMAVIQALSIEMAEILFASPENTDIDVIAIDGCMGMDGNTFNTLPLAKKIRATFHGKMIAIASTQAIRDELVEAGCDEECEKFLFKDKILSLQ